MSSIRIAAIADVHSPRFLHEFKDLLSKCRRPDILLFAGDMVNRGAADEYINVVNAVDSHFGSEIPIAACFGNEDPYDIYEEFHQEVKDRVSFLHNEAITLSISDKRIGIVGMSMASKDSRNVTEIKDIFDERASHLGQLLQTASKQTDFLILLMHFSPLQRNTQNEFSWWVSKALEIVTPNYIIHGHIHDANMKKVEIGATTILNVALPVAGSVTELSL
jgi:Icc-related predicted phosphoesterase